MRTFRIIILCLMIQFGCKDKTTDPPKEDCPPPPKLGCPFKHVEVDDTTRQYVFWDGNVHKLSSSFLFARFLNGTSDSNALALAAKYGLIRRFHAAGVWIFCVPDSVRAEQFFTPYGKQQTLTFGSESLVDVVYAIIDDGRSGYLDDFFVRFDSTISRAAIDSINGLYKVDVDRTLIIAEQVWYKLRVTKASPYSSFDMANLYHCLKEVVDRTAHANVYAFNPPLGERCPPSQQSNIR